MLKTLFWGVRDVRKTFCKTPRLQILACQDLDLVKTLQDRPENVKEILWSEGLWLGEELEKAWENYYEVQGY